MPDSDKHTNLRVFNSDDSSLNVALYMTKLSLRIDPYKENDERGFPIYDRSKGLTTTLDPISAAGLYKFVDKIVNAKAGEKPISLPIPCLAGASLTIERRPASNNEGLETFLVINSTKEGKAFQFKFSIIEYKVMEAGQWVTKVIEAGLAAFMMTIEGYLTCTGVQIHLDKLLEAHQRAIEEQIPDGYF